LRSRLDWLEEVQKRRLNEYEPLKTWLADLDNRISLPGDDLGMRLSKQQGHEQLLADIQTAIDQTNTRIEALNRRSENRMILRALAKVYRLERTPVPELLELIPEERRARIEKYWRGLAEQRGQESLRQQRELEELQRQNREELASVERMNLDDLLETAFGTWFPAGIDQGFKTGTLDVEQYEHLLRQKSFEGDPVKLRACERLIDIGTEMLKETTLDALNRSRPQSPQDQLEEQAKREREELEKIERMEYQPLVDFAHSLGLIAGGDYAIYRNLSIGSANERLLRSCLSAMGQKTGSADPVRRRVVERLVETIEAQIRGAEPVWAEERRRAAEKAFEGWNV
jgi:hypothetical protein